jgi:hypothetical protein
MFRSLFPTDSWPERNGFQRQTPEWLWPSVGVSNLTSARSRPHEHPARYRRKGQIVSEHERNAKSQCTNFTNSCVVAESFRLGGSLALPTHRAKESLREITWNGANETVIRCSSSIKSSLAGSSKILTITAFFSGRAVSKVVWPRFP